MRSAPKDRKTNYTDSDPSTTSFAAASSTHFQVLDAEGLAVEQQRIDDAARRLLSRRRNGPSKAWGAPASTEQDYRRSLMPRSPHSRVERKTTSPKRRGLSKEDSDVLNYAFVPESERAAAVANARPRTAGDATEQKRTTSERKTKSGLEEIPSDFVDKLHLMRNNSAVKEKDLEEKYEAERDSPTHSKRGHHHPHHHHNNNNGSPVKKWTSAVRDAFVEERTTDPKNKRRRQKRSAAVPVRKKPNTITQPFAGVEARSTIKTVSRSMERTMADLAEQQAAEAESLKYKWEAKPVPRAVKENRYQALLDKAEAKRIKESAARKQNLNETLKPFPGLERREKEGKRKKLEKEEARRALIAATKAEEKRKKVKSQRAFRQAAAKSAAGEQDRGAAEVERRARVQRRAAKLLHSAKMPARMEMWEKTKKQNAKDDSSGTSAGQNAGSIKLNKIR